MIQQTKKRRSEKKNERKTKDVCWSNWPESRVARQFAVDVYWCVCGEIRIDSNSKENDANLLYFWRGSTSFDTRDDIDIDDTKKKWSEFIAWHFDGSQLKIATRIVHHVIE